MKKIKKILGSVCFLLIVLVLMVPISYSLRTNSINRDMLTPFYAEDEDSIDVMYLGSSAVYRYYVSPMQWKSYGYTSFNYATAGQPIDAIVHDITEIEKTQDPDVYVIELRMLLVEQNYALTGTDNKMSSHIMHYNDIVNGMRYSKNRAELTQKLFPDDISWQIDIIRNHVNWKKVSPRDLLNGFIPQKDATKGVMTRADFKVIDDTSATSTDMTVSLTDKGYSQLTEICDYLDKLGKQGLFLVSPYVEPTKPEQQARMMAVADETERFVTERGYKFLNLCYKTQEIGLNYSTDFYNHRHVNVLGAQKVTDYVGEYIDTNFDIDKTHSDSTKKEWDAAYDKWLVTKASQEKEMENLLS